MFVIAETVPAGVDRDHYQSVSIGLPYGRKSARADLYVNCDPKEGASLYGALNLEGKNHGLWGGGDQWELYVPGRKLVGVELSGSARGIYLRHMGGTSAPLMVTVSGT